MAQYTTLGERRTSVDDVYDFLHAKIVSLHLRPGDRISEAEVATQFGVSRQPVRDAFNRLANQDLLLIRPQRATEVRRFSKRRIEKSRFIRAAVEKEVLYRAASNCDRQGRVRLESVLSQQLVAVEEKDVESFGKLDYEFHQVLCGIAEADYAFDVILEEKAKIDRLCMLGLEKEQRLPDLLEDHKLIAHAVIMHDADSAILEGMKHLSRLDETIERISATNSSYFERED